MWTRALLTAFLIMVRGAARADFSIICDERGQLEDILHTTQAKGFGEATLKFRAYSALRDERDEPTCEVSHIPGPASVGQVVSRFDSIEFLPAELHDVLIVEIQVGERTLFGTLNHFVAPKASETGL